MFWAFSPARDAHGTPRNADARWLSEGGGILKTPKEPHVGMLLADGSGGSDGVEAQFLRGQQLFVSVSAAQPLEGRTMNTKNSKTRWNAVGALLGLAALAAPGVAFATWTTVTEVRTLAGHVIITLNGNYNGCGGTKVLVESSSGQAIVAAAQQLAVAALLSGKEIEIANVSCQQTPWANTATTTDIKIK